MSYNSVIKIGTRASDLAVSQAVAVKNAILSVAPNYKDSDIQIIKITTSGDKLAEQKLSLIGGKNLFTKEIEDALLKKEIDIAVHSMKDMPAISPAGLQIMAMLPREDARDALIIKDTRIHNIDYLPHNAVVATSAMRRKAMLLKYRKDLNIIDIRGNINTRLKKLQNQKIDAIILAVAGLKRIGKAHHITQYIDHKVMLPAVGQGALGVQCCEDNLSIINVLTKINHEDTAICVNAERVFMKDIDGDCNTPMGCYAMINDDEIEIHAEILTVDGKKSYQKSLLGKKNNAINMAANIADIVKSEAQEILAEIKLNKNAE
jgi:hydroxymethylbilane synthase